MLCYLHGSLSRKLGKAGTLPVNKTRCPLSCIRRSKAFDQGMLLLPSTQRWWVLTQVRAQIRRDLEMWPRGRIPGWTWPPRRGLKKLMFNHMKRGQRGDHLHQPKGDIQRWQISALPRGGRWYRKGQWLQTARWEGQSKHKENFFARWRVQCRSRLSRHARNPPWWFLGLEGVTDKGWVKCWRKQVYWQKKRKTKVLVSLLNIQLWKAAVFKMVLHGSASAQQGRCTLGKACAQWGVPCQARWVPVTGPCASQKWIASSLHAYSVPAHVEG